MCGICGKNMREIAKYTATGDMGGNMLLYIKS